MQKVFGLIAGLFLSVQGACAAPDVWVYFGSHSSGPGAGFSIARFDPETGALTTPKFLLAAKEPAFFILNGSGTRLYTCNSGNPGGLSAYAVDRTSGGLTLLNRVLAGGGDTSFITLDRTERFVLVANYDGGSLAAFALRPDGSIGDWTSFIQHHGHSVNPVRQTHAYAHSIILDPSNRFALSADLGEDRLYVYRFDANSGTLTPNRPAFASVRPGSGARHVRFHPNGRWVYLINEIASTIDAFDWDASSGALSQVQEVSALPADFHGVSACAELEVHPNGRFLYATNRGHDSIAVFAIDLGSGRLSLVEHVPSGGRTPRNFAFDSTGRWMVVTNQGSENAVVFRVDNVTGRLFRAGLAMGLRSPFCERCLGVQAGP